MIEWHPIETEAPPIKPGRKLLWFQPAVVRKRRDMDLAPRIIEDFVRPSSSRTTTHWAFPNYPEV